MRTPRYVCLIARSLETPSTGGEFCSDLDCRQTGTSPAQGIILWWRGCFGSPSTYQSPDFWRVLGVLCRVQKGSHATSALRCLGAKKRATDSCDNASNAWEMSSLTAYSGSFHCREARIACCHAAGTASHPNSGLPAILKVGRTSWEGIGPAGAVATI